MNPSTAAFPVSPCVQPLVTAITQAGGRPFIVGGAVRDWQLGASPKDLDIEVFGLSPEQLERALASFKVDAVGRAFGVLKVGLGS